MGCASYVVGCDGARSRVREVLGIPRTGDPAVAHLTNVLFQADLARFIVDREIGGCMIPGPQPGRPHLQRRRPLALPGAVPARIGRAQGRVHLRPTRHCDSAISIRQRSPSCGRHGRTDLRRNGRGVLWLGRSELKGTLPSGWRATDQANHPHLGTSMRPSVVRHAENRAVA